MRHTWMATASALALVLFSATGCSTWDGMSRAEKGAVIGAGAGALIGNNIGDGSGLNTVGGAAVGGAIGYGVGNATRK